MTSALEIAIALDGKRTGGGWIARCPAHDDRTPSLSIRASDEGHVLVRCHAGCDQTAVINALKARGLWPNGDGTAPAFVPFTPRPRTGGHSAARTEAARVLWAQARPVAGTIAEGYLRGRGIRVDLPPCLRFLPNAWHAPTKQSLPCLIAAVETDSGGVVAVHRTFLAPDGSGKAKVDPVKMALGSIAGGAVRFAVAGVRLGICEGIEDGLSVVQSEPSLPVWATLGTSGLGSVILPDCVREVVILSDGDRAGMEAANFAARRYETIGKIVRVAKPPAPYKDFNDALRATPAMAGAA
jgi:putative DNA primase/helicase